MELHDFAIIAIGTLGFITLLKIALNFLKWVYTMFFRPPKNLKDYGSWALITGATDGIGKAMAFELAAKGLNIILLGRNPMKLDATTNEIHERFGEQVETKKIVIDLAKISGKEIDRTVERAIKGLDVGVLINNAGLADTTTRFFHDVDKQTLNSIMRVNIEAINWVTRPVLKGMLKKKRGAIVNIGSGTAFAVSSFPFHAIYAATKAYIAMFSKCISLEYKQQGIDIQCQIPLYVATKMASIKKSSFFVPSPEAYSKASIRWIGCDDICVPYWTHYVQCRALRILPDALLDWYLFQSFHKRVLEGRTMSTKKNP